MKNKREVWFWVEVLLLVAFGGCSVLLSRGEGDEVKTTARGTALFCATLPTPVTRGDLDKVKSVGGRVVEVPSMNELLVEASVAQAQRLSRGAVVRPVGHAEKISDDIDLTSPLPSSLTVLPLDGRDLDAVERKVVELGGSVIGRAGEKDGMPRLRVRLAGTSVGELAEVAEVQWIERYVQPRLLNDVVVSNALMNVESVRTIHGITGKGQVITTSDSGVDTGNFETMHPDLRSNVVGFKTVSIASTTVKIQSSDTDGHGTHTAGSIVGTGSLSGGQLKGAAPEAKLWAWFCLGSDGGVYTPSDLSSLFRPSELGTTNAYIHSASWGSSQNVYSLESKALDDWCWKHPDFLPVFAAGNGDTSGNGNTDRKIFAEGAAKNVLCVGATENYRPNKGSNANNPAELAYFSSRGPLPDGRIKPDICAPGTYVVSTRSRASTKTAWGVYAANTNYLYNGGTSMATPLTAGTVALIRQWLVEREGFTNRAPSSALMKAIITGGATRLGSATPNREFGWGRVNLEETLFPTNGGGVVLKDYIPFRQGSKESFEVTVSEARPLDVQLCWVDYPAAVKAAKTKSLIIDLDLVVSNQVTGATWRPNDRTNNLESVHIASATPAKYTITVIGYNTPIYTSDSGGAVAVYVRGATEKSEKYVMVTVAAEGGSDHNCKPETGVHKYAKGETVTFAAGKYSDEKGEDYRYSSGWGLDVERYQLNGWKVAEGVSLREGSGREVTLTLTNDLTLTWNWQATAGEVGLWLESYDEFHEMLMYPGMVSGRGYWIARGEEVTMTAEDSPMMEHYAGKDEGWTIPVNGTIYANQPSQPYQYGTLRFASFYVMDEDQDGEYRWNENDHYRLGKEITLTMNDFTAVDFGYCDETNIDRSASLPFWWWMRNFYGAVEYGEVAVAKTFSTGDPDNDGFANLAEYEEPTDPWNIESFPFRFTEFSPARLTFIGSTAGSLQLQRSGRADGGWSNVWSAATVRTTVTNHVNLTEKSVSNAFYRVFHTSEALSH